MPRYVSTRLSPANARVGPGDDYKLKWVYHSTGIPLQVVEETADWRRVCDPDGGLAWVHRRLVGPDRRVLNRGADELILRARPKEDARIVAKLAGRATAALGPCKAGWCKLKADRVSGWAQDAHLWGVGEGRQCR